MFCPMARIFKINNINANLQDFGDLIVTPYAVENPSEYGCDDRDFFPSDDEAKKHKAMAKYKITEEQYNHLQNILNNIDFHGCEECE